VGSTKHIKGKIMKLKLIIILVVLLLLTSGTIVFANAAESPSIIVVIPNAPDDLEISLIVDDETIEPNVSSKFFERRYMFYAHDLKSVNDYVLKIDHKKVEINTRLQTYNNLFYYDLEDQTLTPGKSLPRTIAFTALRILLTIAIEALIFYLFGFRDKNSWIIFIVVNLITQGTLNIWLNSFSPVTGYIIFSLVFGEIFVFIFEEIAMLKLIKEQRKLVTFFYVFIANFCSLYFGGYLLQYIPF
jgi:hypothetical protein